MKKILSLFVFVLLLTSITTAVYANKVDDSAIINGKTTKKEINALKGEPKNIKTEDNKEIWTYCEKDENSTGVSTIEFDKNGIVEAHGYDATSLFGAIIGTPDSPNKMLCGIK